MNWKEIVGENYEKVGSSENIETRITHRDKNGNTVRTFIEASRHKKDIHWTVNVYDYWDENGAEKMDTSVFKMDDKELMVYIKVLRGEATVVTIADLFEGAYYCDRGYAIELNFNRVFETDNGDLLVEFELEKQADSALWIGQTFETMIDEDGNMQCKANKVTYTSSDLLNIYEASYAETPIVEIVDEYTASENAEHVLWGWSNEDDEDADTDRWANLFASRMKGDSHWVVSMQLVDDCNGVTVFIGEFSDFQLVEFIDQFDNKYADKYYSENFKV